jgi:hypothetical protein
VSSAKIIGIDTGAEDEEKAQESFSEFQGEGAPTRTSSDTIIVIGNCGLCSLAQGNPLNIDRLSP